jgi:hypothetical protein
MTRHRARPGERFRSIPASRCAECGKLSYATKSDAKLAAKRTDHGGTRLDVYRCPHRPESWHCGHLPRAVVRGEVGREHIGKPGASRGQVITCCATEVIGTAHPDGSIGWRCPACTRTLRLADDEANRILGALWAAGVKPTLELVEQARGRVGR